MPYNMMAGALAKGLEGALGGVSSGLLEGEKIRRGRAEEELQRDYLQKALAQMLATQQYQHGRLGLEQQRLTGEEAWRGAQIGHWGLQAGQEERRQEEIERANRARAAEAARGHDITERHYRDVAGETRRWHDLTIAEKWARTGIMAKKIEANPALTAAQKLQARAVEAKLRGVRQQIALAHRDYENNMLTAPGISKLQDLVRQEAELEAMLDQMAATAAAPGVAPPAPAPEPAPKPTSQSIRQKWGLGG